MARIKRIIINDYPYFITNITDGRRPFLLENIDLFWSAVETANKKIPFDLFAWVILPDHFHFIINPGKGNISDIMKKIKQIFGANYRKRHRLLSGSAWQESFYDHIIRNEKDMRGHLNYIHWNPVKHGLVTNPFEYPHSSIMKFKDFYPQDWGMREDEIKGDFGE